MLHQLELVGTALLTVLSVLGVLVGIYVIFKAEKAKSLYDKRQQKVFKRQQEALRKMVPDNVGQQLRRFRGFMNKAPVDDESSPPRF